MNNKVVLAYSGGLDTTYCAIYLQKVKGLEIHALTVNTGGFSSKEIEQIAARAKSLGVASFERVDVQKNITTAVSNTSSSATSSKTPPIR